MNSQDPSLANDVIRLREIRYHHIVDQLKISGEELQAAIRFAELFGPPWRIPITLNFIALLAHRTDDEAIINAFGGPPSQVCCLLLQFEQADSYRWGETAVLCAGNTSNSLPNFARSETIEHLMRSIYCMQISGLISQFQTLDSPKRTNLMSGHRQLYGSWASPTERRDSR